MGFQLERVRKQLAHKGALNPFRNDAEECWGMKKRGGMAQLPSLGKASQRTDAECYLLQVRGVTGLPTEFAER